MIDYYMSTLIPLSPLHSPVPSQAPRRAHSSACRHITYPSIGSDDFPITPPPPSPASSHPHSVIEPHAEDSPSETELVASNRSSIAHTRGESVITVSSQASIYTFGIPGLS